MNTTLCTRASEGTENLRPHRKDLRKIKEVPSCAASGHQLSLIWPTS